MKNGAKSYSILFFWVLEVLAVPWRRAKFTPSSPIPIHLYHSSEKDYSIKGCWSVRPQSFARDIHHTEAKKTARFIRGFRLTIHNDITGAPRSQTLNEAIWKAYWSKNENQRISKELASRRETLSLASHDRNLTPQHSEFQDDNPQTCVGCQGMPNSEYFGKNVCRLRNEACFVCGGLDHKVRDSPYKRNRAQGSSSNKAMSTCYICGQDRLKIRSCPRRRNKVLEPSPKVPETPMSVTPPSRFYETDTQMPQAVRNDWTTDWANPDMFVDDDEGMLLTCFVCA